MAVTEEAFAEWLAHPVTQEFRAEMGRREQYLMETWARTEENLSPDVRVQARMYGDCARMTYSAIWGTDDSESKSNAEA